MVGTCGFTRFHFDTNAAEIGYVLNPKFWGRGIASEAVACVLDFGFRKLNLHRIEARFMEENKKSFEVMQRCGMHFEGIQRDLMFVKDRYVSVGTCSILSQEFFDK